MQSRLWRKAAMIAAPIVAVIALSAQIAFSEAAARGTASRLAIAPAASGQDRGDGSAAAPFFTAMVASATASPSEGTTGTIALPPEPSDAPAPVTFDTTIVAARPFSSAGASALDRGRALECLTAAIYYEAASEPDDGQRGVAQVILNRVRHPAFPHTVCGVVYQGSERTSGCQFSFACDGAMARIPSKTGWARAMRNAAVALSGQVFAPVGLATHYHTYAVTPAWNRTLVMTDAIGAHFFHRWKGYWGTAAAFSAVYRGAEPVPGPHAKLSPIPGGSFFAGPILAAAAPTAVAPRAMTIADVQPAHVDSGAQIAKPDESQILDRWKDSGKPLR